MGRSKFHSTDVAAEMRFLQANDDSIIQTANTQESQAIEGKTRKIKKRKIDDIEDVTITSVTEVQKPRCSYKQLLGNAAQFVKVKEEKVEENIASKNSSEWRTTGRSNADSNDWSRQRKTLKVSNVQQVVWVKL